MKRNKLNKTQKKNINRIINKWAPTIASVTKSPKREAFINSVWASSLIAGDLALTGGSLLSLSALIPALSSSSDLFLNLPKFKTTNNYGQNFKATPKNTLIIVKMDRKMTELFNQFSTTINKEQRSKLRKTMQELYADTQSLNSLYTVIDDPSNQFKFLLEHNDRKLEFEEAINLRRPRIKDFGT